MVFHFIGKLVIYIDNYFLIKAPIKLRYGFAINSRLTNRNCNFFKCLHAHLYNVLSISSDIKRYISINRLGTGIPEYDLSLAKSGKIKDRVHNREKLTFCF